MRSNVIYIIVMALVSYTIRILPLTLIRKPIKNRFIQSFLYYVPYVTLAVMTFPAIVHATESDLRSGSADRGHDRSMAWCRTFPGICHLLPARICDRVVCISYNKNHVDFLGYESIFRHIIANGSYVAFVV